MPPEVRDELISIGLIVVAILLFLSNFHILGAVGNAVSGFMFGLFGISAYVLPVAVAVICFFKINKNLEDLPVIRVVGILLALLMLGVIGQMISNCPDAEASYQLKEIFTFSKENNKGGGLLSGSLAFLMVKLLDKVGTWLIVIVILIICFVLITGRSFLSGIAGTASRTRRAASDYRERIREENEKNAPIREQRRKEAEEARELRRVESEREKERRRREKEEREQAVEDEKVIREVSGSKIYNLVPEESVEELKKERNNMHEINYAEDFPEDDTDEGIVFHTPESSYEKQQEEEEFIPEPAAVPAAAPEVKKAVALTPAGESIFAEGDHTPTNGGRTFGTKSGTAAELAPKDAEVHKPKRKKPYKFPPIDLLDKPPAHTADDRSELQSTARKLEEVLESFNINAKITEISQGPTVTRYEMIPAPGTKVSKIVSLSDDIKLNIAAADIRIEAPIPGKSAIGIEVPNKKSSPVFLRELIESKEYKSAESKISFAVGKDLAGQVIITDIAKMPHMLIAGGTGSGKSVCINTLIMSILYKSTPDEVKMIMVDPKVVELSVYNGIPHLLIPVVTDPKKASAALQWAVAEMDSRYQKFAEYGVRNLKGYNEAIATETDDNGQPLSKMFQLVVIVDELADLMMVAGKEVEESICRLAQLARAAGIHLVIATQRPSVNVITGLIKANMPSRVAFAVSSGVDSRTILDMNGAEKLLGKGDMLFAPQGYPKPARLQGAYVDDKEVAKVVDFLKSNADEEDTGREEILKKIDSASSGSGSTGSMGGMSSSDGGDGQDEYFAEAAHLIVGSGKSSIGMLQRKFKIGFNRAARIMDALADAGIVGPEDGTKARAILMDETELESYLETL